MVFIKTLLKMAGGCIPPEFAPGSTLLLHVQKWVNFQPWDAGEKGQPRAQSHVLKSTDFIISAKWNQRSARNRMTLGLGYKYRYTYCAKLNFSQIKQVKVFKTTKSYETKLVLWYCPGLELRLVPKFTSSRADLYPETHC